MTASVDRASHKNAERWRWLLYVVLAIVGALLTFVGARAQQKATDEANFRKLIDNFLRGLEHGNGGGSGEILCKGQRPDFLRCRSLCVPRLEGISRRSAEGVSGECFGDQADRR